MDGRILRVLRHRWQLSPHQFPICRPGIGPGQLTALPLNSSPTEPAWRAWQSFTFLHMRHGPRGRAEKVELHVGACDSRCISRVLLIARGHPPPCRGSPAIRLIYINQSAACAFHILELQPVPEVRPFKPGGSVSILGRCLEAVRNPPGEPEGEQQQVVSSHRVELRAIFAAPRPDGWQIFRRAGVSPILQSPVGYASEADAWTDGGGRPHPAPSRGTQG
jgi:hypothetical protein